MSQQSFRSFLISLVLLLGALLMQIPAQAEATTLLFFETGLHSEGGAYEINPAPDGTLWVSDNFVGEIRAYAADGSLVTIFSELGRVSDARSSGTGTAWYVNQEDQQLGELDFAAGSVTFWELPAMSESGFGTALDEKGRVWISDFNVDPVLLYRFDPDLQEMCTFHTEVLAITGSPYVLYDGTSFWLSDFFGHAVVRFDPEDEHMTRWKYESIFWFFEAEGMGSDGAGGLWFADAVSNSLVHLDLVGPDDHRFLRYQLPVSNGKPHMLSVHDGLVWFSAQMPGRLGVLNPAYVTPVIYTPVITEAQVPKTCNPLEARDPVTVTVTTETPEWVEVEYPLKTPSDGWKIVSLPTDSSPWGVALQEGSLWAVDNGRAVLMRTQIAASVQVCALRDADGELGTTSDREPLAGQQISLLVDDVSLEPAQLMGDDGCYAWKDLAPAHIYSVKASESPGWVLLSDPLVDLGIASPGETLRHDFLFARGKSSVYLPMIQR